MKRITLMSQDPHASTRRSVHLLLPALHLVAEPSFCCIAWSHLWGTIRLLLRMRRWH